MVQLPELHLWKWSEWNECDVSSAANYPFHRPFVPKFMEMFIDIKMIWIYMWHDKLQFYIQAFTEVIFYFYSQNVSSLIYVTMKKHIMKTSTYEKVLHQILTVSYGSL